MCVCVRERERERRGDSVIDCPTTTTTKVKWNAKNENDRRNRIKNSETGRVNTYDLPYSVRRHPHLLHFYLSLPLSLTHPHPHTHTHTHIYIYMILELFRINNCDIMQVAPNRMTSLFDLDSPSPISCLRLLNRLHRPLSSPPSFGI